MATQTQQPTSNRSGSSRRGWKERFGQRRSRRAFRAWPRLIRESEAAHAKLTDAQLLDEADRLRELAASSADPSLVPEFCGVVCEAVFRAKGFRLYDVQLQAIAAGAAGNVVEMQTGEGKTVVTGAIAAIKTLNSPSVHVSTTNTYLAERDLEELTTAFGLLGISSGLLPEESNENLSRSVYRNQVVYGPGYQYGFDYLRDQMLSLIHI